MRHLGNVSWQKSKLQKIGFHKMYHLTNLNFIGIVRLLILKRRSDCIRTFSNIINKYIHEINYKFLRIMSYLDSPFFKHQNEININRMLQYLMQKNVLE